MYGTYSLKHTDNVQYKLFICAFCILYRIVKIMEFGHLFVNIVMNYIESLYV